MAGGRRRWREVEAHVGISELLLDVLNRLLSFLLLAVDALLLLHEKMIMSLCEKT